MAPPTKTIPDPKELTSPINPMKVGTAPPPIIKASGTVKETAIFLSLAELTMDSAAIPAGKKQTAMTGCKKTAAVTQAVDDRPIKTVINPVNINPILKTPLGPKRSVAHPPASVTPILATLDNAIRVLAQLRSMPCSLTRNSDNME
jgi:hypothetical protein